MPLSGVIRRHRIAIASNLALAIAVTGVVVAAVYADGYRAHEAQLNDGGIWVTNNKLGSYGRVNKPINQLDGALFADLDTQLDVVQDGASVVGVSITAGIIAPIDPASVDHPDGEVAKVPSAAQIQLAGETIAVLDPVGGILWAERIDPELGVPLVGSLDSEAPPLAKVGVEAALAVTTSGRVLAVSADDDTLTTLRPSDTGFGPPQVRKLASDVGPSVTLTAVGETAVALDEENGSLEVLGGPEVDVPTGSVLQQPGPDAGSVLVATSDRLLAVDLETGEQSTVAEGVTGRPTAPVRLGACSYGAWSGGLGAVATRCGEDNSVTNLLDGAATDLVFRVNRGEILLNDRASGAVWDLDSKEPTRIDNWQDFKQQDNVDDDDEQNEQEEIGNRRPPAAKPDNLGARLGRTTVLHPLDNDTAPEGRLLAIISVDKVSGSDADVTISPDGQTVQIKLPPEADTTTFEYYIDDGRAISAHATVTVTPRDQTVNAAPHQREGFKPRLWIVPSGGTLDIPILPDWRDTEDGDPLSVDSAEAAQGDRTGAVARTTASGRIRFTAPVEQGVVEVEYAVTDGIGEPITEDLKIQVQGRKDRLAHEATAEPDVVAGEAGKPITIRPLANDLPGSDPVTPDAVLELAGKVAEVGGAEVRSDLVAGTITFRSTQPKTYFLDYDAAYGNAPFARGRVRVDVRASKRPPQAPVAMPDSVSLFGQAPTLVDVLANDIDPTGGLLVVQSAGAVLEDQIDVAVVDGRWLRLSVRQGALQPRTQLVRYRISNGTRTGVEGEVVVTQKPPPADNSPVTEIDRVVVRAGGGASIPVLDNDFSPAGDELGLVGDVAGESNAGQLTVLPPGDQQVPTGEAFIADRFVRYVAPASVDDEQTFTTRYLARNVAGQTSPGKIEITVIPETRRNDPPEPPTLEGRAVAGDTVRLKLPGAGVDPDGDPVTLTGITSAPGLGRIVRFGANSLQYQAYPDSVGTDEFTYSVTDPFGAQASASVRVAIVAPGTPQPPLAVADTVTVEPGRVARVQVLANDLVAAGDRVSIDLVTKTEGVTQESTQGPIRIEAPPAGEGRNIEVVYRLTNGLASSQATITLRVAEPYNNPPVVFDAFGEAVGEDGGDGGDTVTVDVLETAYDPDGATKDLRVTDVFAPAALTPTINGGSVTVARGPQPAVIPFRVEDADGGAATASLFVPPTGAGAPYVRPGSLIKLDPGDTGSYDLADFVVDPAGGPVQFTLKGRISPSPVTALAPSITGNGTFDVKAAPEYAGPGAVVFEVTTGTSVDDPEGVLAVLSVPVQVGAEKPILRCPDTPIEIAQEQSLELDISRICHVWTPDPDDAGSLSFDADWQTSVDGLAIITPSGQIIEVNADGSATPGSSAVLQVTAEGSDPGRLQFQVVKSPPPSLDPIRIDDMRAGESRTLDLAPYLRPGIADPEPTVVEVEQLTDLDVDIADDGGSGVTITTGPEVDGRAEFRVLMSDVAGSTGPERQVEGRISLEIRDVPGAPTAPVAGNTPRDAEVALSWRAPEANGAPIDRYELRGSGGVSKQCGGTSCEVTGLTNGQPYSFQVRAHNAVGWSDWSPQSRAATPDIKPGQVGPIELLNEADGKLTFRWSPPTTETSEIIRYHVSYPGGSNKTTSRPQITVGGLNNNIPYAFTVAAENKLDIGPGRRSAAYQSIGTPGTPAVPAITDQKTPGDNGAVTLTWPAVNPNGPTPVRYTVFRDGAPIAACANITVTRCDNSGMAYDGRSYTYTVQATNKDGDGLTSPQSGPAVYTAVGTPAEWGGWNLAATGANNGARAEFTVPPSRGARSLVRIYVINGTGSPVFEAVGGQNQPFDVPSNDGPHSVFLEVCNEAGACSRSSTQSVQTYGPLVSGHIISVTPRMGDAVPNREVAWEITVDSNGDPATVRVQSSKRDETFNATGVDVFSFVTRSVDIGYSSTETIQVTISDGSPGGRGSGTRTATSPSTSAEPPPEPPPPPPEPPTVHTVRVSQGAHCNDSGPRCSVSGPSCSHPSCAHITVTTTGFTSTTANCDFYDTIQGRFTSRTISTNRADQTTAYFGFPGEQVWAICGGSYQSPRFTWPNS
ncbi:MAG: Ig-like domain-containing protein [Nocardioides sp.]